MPAISGLLKPSISTTASETSSVDSWPVQPIMTIREVHDVVARIIGAEQERLIITKPVAAAADGMTSRRRRAPLTADLIRTGVAPRATIEGFTLG